MALGVLEGDLFLALQDFTLPVVRDEDD